MNVSLRIIRNKLVILQTQVTGMQQERARHPKSRHRIMDTMLTETWYM